MCDFFFQNSSWWTFVESWSRSCWIYHTDNKYSLMLRSTDKCHADRISCTPFWWVSPTPLIYSVIWPSLFTLILDTVKLSLQYLHCYILLVILCPGHYFAERHTFYKNSSKTSCLPFSLLCRAITPPFLGGRWSAVHNTVAALRAGDLKGAWHYTDILFLVGHLKFG